MKVSDIVRRYPYPILLTAFVLWVCIGVFPLQCYETDGLEIILGCDILYNDGWQLPPVYSYEYRMQPLMTIVIVGLKHLVPFLTCEEIYCILTALSSLLFLLGCVSLARRVTGAGHTEILLAAMLLPEMYAIAMYPNTAIPSAACLVGALVLITQRRYWLSGVLMCAAILFRLDIVIVFPVILPLLYFEGKTIRQTITLAAAYVAGVVAAALLAFWAVGADALTTFREYERWNGIITPQERILAIWGFYSLAYFILLPLGLLVIVRQRRWKELMLVVIPILLVHGIFASFGNASKHFLYNAPFVIIAGVRALTWLTAVLRDRPVLKWSAIIAAVLFMTVSVRKQSLSMPWLKTAPLHQAGMVVPLWSVERGESEIIVGIGAGYQILTNDEDMLATGHLFYSWYIHSIKRIIGEWRAQQKAVLDQAGTSNILTFEWGASAPVAIDYMSEQGHFHRLDGLPETYYFTLTNRQRDLHFWRIVLPGAVTDKQQLVEYIDSLSPLFLQGDSYVLPASNHYGTAPYLEQLCETGMIEKKADKLYKITNK